MDENHEDPLREFEDRWKEWGRRPAGTSPDVAARRILACLPERPARWGGIALIPARRLLVAAAAGILVLSIAVIRRDGPPSVQEAPGPTEAPIELNENVTLIWLDTNTPLYMTLRSPEAVRGESP